MVDSDGCDLSRGAQVDRYYENSLRASRPRNAWKTWSFPDCSTDGGGNNQTLGAEPAGYPADWNSRALQQRLQANRGVGADEPHEHPPMGQSSRRHDYLEIA